MKNNAPAIAAAGLVIGTAALVVKKLLEEPLDTVPHVDLHRYLGRWYEIAAFPQRFEKDCTYTTAQYSLNEDGSIHVKNSCISQGKQKTAIGKAVVTDFKSNSKLNVQFFWPFSGKYWIIELADDYSYAMVGHPNRKYLWILSRKPWMEKATYRSLLISAMNKGFDISKLRVTPQKSGD